VCVPHRRRPSHQRGIPFFVPGIDVSAALNEQMDDAEVAQRHGFEQRGVERRRVRVAVEAFAEHLQHLRGR